MAYYHKIIFVFPVIFLFVVLFLVASVSAVDTTYLITYMRFEEGSGTLTNDTRGIQNMTFGGTPAWTGGKVGNNAIQYNSVDDRITAINTYHEYPNNFTICYWGYTTAFGTGRNFYLFSGNQSVTYWAWAMYDTSGTGELIYRKGATDSTAVADTTTGGWNFYCAAKNDTTVVVYKNNATTLATLTGAVSGASAGMNLTIGGDISASTGYNGKIDEVSIWNKSLNSSEVRDVYNFGAANQTISSVFPPTVSFQGQTPVSGSVELANGSNAVTVNLSVSNLGGMSGLDLYLYNLTGSLRAQYYYQANASDLNGLTQSFDTKNISGYVINATVHNFTNAIIFDDSGNGRNLLTLNSPEINSSCGFSGNGFCSLSATALIGKGANISYNMVSITDSNDFSLGGWFKINSCDTNASHSNMGGIGKNFLWGINFVGSSGGKCYPAFSIRNFSGSTITTIANTSYNLTSDNDGAFINATYNATSKEMRLYIDGELHANGTKNALITINSTSASKYFGFGWSYFVTGGNGVNGNYSADNLFFSNGTNTYTWSFDSVGYPYNASSESRTFYTYNVSVGGITSPANASALSNRYQNVSWSNGTPTPSGVPVNISYSTLFLYNSSFGFVKILANTTNLNLTNWDVYNENLSIGVYYLKLNQTDTQGNTVTNGYHQINITTNSRLNITAITAVTGAAVTTFNGWVYHEEDGTNTTYTTTSGQALVELVKGNITVYIESMNYSSNNTLQGVNLTNNTQNLVFTLYETNTVNITFYNEADPTTILNTTNITIDFIGTTSSYNYTTSNGTLYVSLITPDTYILRYGATGYTERFYTFTLTNKTYNALNLYMINATNTINLTVSVVDELVTPYTNVNVKSLKYDLATGTYILQEIKGVNSNGQAILKVTFNDEFYKFIIEDQATGDVLKTTEPDYITDDELTIQINRASDYGAEAVGYDSITASVQFNTATNNFRFDWNDATGITDGVLLTTYLFANGSYTLVNSTTSTSASGTILHTVTAVNGTTYVSYAYYLSDSQYEYLTGAIYTYPLGSNNVWGKMGLLVQIMLTLGVSSLAFISPVAAVILSPLSIVIGAYVGWITLSTTLIAGYLLVMGLIIAIVMSVKK